MQWLELSSRVDGEAVEAVSEVFSRVVSGGVVVEPDLEIGADAGGTIGRLATVRGYVPRDDQAERKQQTVDEALWHLRAIWPVGELQVRPIAEEDWANAWKEHFQTFRLGERIVIHPSWLEYTPLPDDVVISLDPGAAFGTGLHPTTRRCLELLEDSVRPGVELLDVGTGSGILSLAAAGLGAARVFATDVDPVAVATAKSNVALSAAAERIEVVPGSVDAAPLDQHFDVVVANIIARVILELAPELIRRVRPDGLLILGGIIAERADEVAKRLAALGCTFERYVDGDWVTFRAHLAGAS